MIDIAHVGAGEQTNDYSTMEPHMAARERACSFKSTASEAHIGRSCQQCARARHCAVFTVRSPPAHTIDSIWPSLTPFAILKKPSIPQSVFQLLAASQY